MGRGVSGSGRTGSGRASRSPARRAGTARARERSMAGPFFCGGARCRLFYVRGDGPIDRQEKTLRPEGSLITAPAAPPALAVRQRPGTAPAPGILGDTQVTDVGIKELKKLQSLEWLMLDHTKVTDAELKGLKSLQTLDLFQTEVTDVRLKEASAGSRSHARVTSVPFRFSSARAALIRPNTSSRVLLRPS